MAQRDPESFFCLICEDVRLEVGQKLTLLGFTPGYTLNVQPGITNPQLNLSLVFVFNKGEGEFAGSFSLTGPNGIVGAELPVAHTHVGPDSSMASVFQFKPTPQIPLGQYLAKVTLNRRTYEQEIILRAGPGTVVAPGPEPASATVKH